MVGSFGDILDGSSNVIMLGECRWRVKDTAGTIRTAGAAVVFGIRRVNAPNMRCDAVATGWAKINATAPNDNVIRRGFSSQHPGGAMFVLADGSVQFLSETIEYDFNDAVNQAMIIPTPLTNDQRNAEVDTTWEKLLGMQDGNPVGSY